MSLHFTRPGLFSLVVDGGRLKTRALGVPVGGPADAPAMRIANRLVGNAPESAALEITLAGPILETDQPVGLALFGAPFQIRRDGEEIPAGSSFTLKPGQRLEIGGTSVGCRAYLAVVGGLRGRSVLGSQTAFTPLLANAQLSCEVSTVRGRTLPASTFPELVKTLLNTEPLEIPGVCRCLAGPQADWFDDQFWNQVYRVSPTGNRMGLRLLGEPLTRSPREMISEAVSPGAVQITNDGLPIVLGMDGQTIGGYPKVAHVLSVDLPQLGQLRPGDTIRFQRVTEEATRLRQQYTDRERAIDEYLNQAIR